MSKTALARPDSTEYAPYYDRYVSLVPEGDIINLLERQLQEVLDLLNGISEDAALKRYAPGKWSIKEVIGHLNDGERIFACRALRFARNDDNKLPGFEQDPYVVNGQFDRQPLADLAQEFSHLRQANLYLFKSLSDEAWRRRGVASDNEVSVKALAYIMAGHVSHHLQVLKTRYL
jgi:DinB superfamily